MKRWMLGITILGAMLSWSAGSAQKMPAPPKTVWKQTPEQVKIRQLERAVQDLQNDVKALALRVSRLEGGGAAE